MGLTSSAVGRGAVDRSPDIRRRRADERVIALAGNPNVGKSTVFNALTGMNQHTGNWPGKTVTNACGTCRQNGHSYLLVDIPGTYSLMAHSAEEEVARNYICFGRPDAVVVVCDATCVERNLDLVLQTMETGARVVVCVNLMDEARRKHAAPDLRLLQQRLGVPVVGTIARRPRTLHRLLCALEEPSAAPAATVDYPAPIEQAIAALQPLLEPLAGDLDPRWLALRLLEEDAGLYREITAYLCADPAADPAVATALSEQRAQLEAAGLSGDTLQEAIASAIVAAAQTLCAGVVPDAACGYAPIDRRIDRVVTGRITAYPVMLLLLALIFWLTIVGANSLSDLLAAGLFRLQALLTALFTHWQAPAWLHGALVLGVYRVLAWVISVMLPPMAIFFPLFTLLEDAGYLPRMAYNLDRPFRRCRACGKQALTMCMGFGCNAAGVVGCRIIDSPRERLLAILTNSLVPCNGRFPALITLLTLFFIGTAGGGNLLCALWLTGVILLGILATFGMTRLLSATVLRGVPSSFTLELPPYRRPQIGRVIVRSILDRTLFVLGRAAAVAAPAGLLIWLLANITVHDATLLQHCAAFLDPFARLMGLDGVILLAFILGFPANEIVIPIILMAYQAQGTLTGLSDLSALQSLLAANGWTGVTAICTILFFLFHWPCSTTLLTVRKETGSWKWTALAAALPTLLGMAVCMLVNAGAHLLGL